MNTNTDPDSTTCEVRAKPGPPGQPNPNIRIHALGCCQHRVRVDSTGDHAENAFFSFSFLKI